MRVPVQKAIREAAHSEPALFAEAIVPVIGPAIRKAIAAALTAMVDRLTRALQAGLSPKSLRWRVEAWRTARPFAEVVLLRTLHFRVEQVFVVHRASGVLLADRVAEGVDSLDPVQVSALLAALGDFAEEAFKERGALETVRIGDLDVWIEAGGGMFVAAVLRGHPPASLRDRLTTTVERIALEAGAAVARFKGDLQDVPTLAPLLSELFDEIKPAGGRARSRSSAIAATLAAVLAGTAVATYVESQRMTHRIDTALADEPGIVVTHVTREGRRWRVEGLRDPLSRSPERVLAGQGIDPSLVAPALTPFISLDPVLVLAHAREVLAPPDTVTLSLDGDLLVAQGTAPELWRRWAERVRSPHPGIRAVDLAGVHTSENP